MPSNSKDTLTKPKARSKLARLDETPDVTTVVSKDRKNTKATKDRLPRKAARKNNGKGCKNPGLTKDRQVVEEHGDGEHSSDGELSHPSMRQSESDTEKTKKAPTDNPVSTGTVSTGKFEVKSYIF